MATSDWSIETQDLRKEYRIGFWMRRFLALEGLTLNVARGESFGFVGPNGAGKTTTIKNSYQASMMPPVVRPRFLGGQFRLQRLGS